jgi:two-component system NtrC family sensor kinase
VHKYLGWQLTFIGVFGFLALVPIVVGTLFAVRGTSSVLYRTISNNLSQTATDKAARITQWLRERTFDIRSLSAVASIRQAVVGPQAVPEAQSLLATMKANYGYYAELSVLGADGRLVASSGTETGSNRAAPGLTFAMSEDVSLSDVQLALPDSQPAMYVTASIWNQDRTRRTGVVVGQIDLDQMDSITADIHPRLGRTAEAYVVNSQGYFLTGSRFEPSGRLKRRIATQGFRDCVETHGSGSAMYPDYRGVSVLGSYTYLPERDWVLLVEQDEAEALAPLRNLRGRIAHFSLLATALVLVFVVGSSGVITRRIRRNDEELERQRKALNRAERLASTGRLAAGIAHEINNPINSIMNCATLMLNRIRLNQYDAAYFSRFLTSIERECRRTARTVRDFLDFSRETQPNFTPVKTGAVVDETLVLLEPEASSRRITIERRLASGLPEITADPEQLRQAFRNIILNACEAMPTGGRLVITTRRTARWLEVEFADTGAGIRSEDLGRIFDPFFTTKSGGSGLGLSVVYGIIDRHDGTIEVESEPGQGTTFLLRFPLECRN